MKIEEERIKTNLLMLDYFDMWDDFHFKSINDTKTLRYYNLISNLIDTQLDATIKWLDSQEAREYFTGESEYQKEVFESLENEWDEILFTKYQSVEALLDEVYRRGKAQGYTDMRERVRYTEADKHALAFVRDYNFELIQRLSDDTTHQIKNKIISGFLAGEHPNQIAPKILSIGEERLDGSTFSPRQRATMIARTEVSRVQNTGILQSYVNEGYTEVKILTAEDSNVCTICLKYAYKFNKNDEITYENREKERIHNIFELIKGENFPPFHPNCRCTYLSIWDSKEESPKNPPIIWLTPNTFNDFGNGVGINNEKREWTLESLKESLEGIIDSEDLEDVANAILNFLENIPEKRWEYISAYDKEFNEKCLFESLKKESVVKLPKEVSNFAEKNGLGMVIHNHTSGVPFPSFNDIKLGNIEYMSKYNVICTENNRIVVIKNNNTESLKFKFVQKRLMSGIKEVRKLVDYDYKNSFERANLIEEMEVHPVTSKEKVIKLSNGYCDYVNDNFYKYCNILNKKFLGTRVSITEVK